MPSKQIVMRAAAIALMFGGVGAYAAQSGLIPGVGNAQSAPQAEPVAADAPEAPVAVAAANPAPSPIPIPAPMPDASTPLALTPDATPQAPLAPQIDATAGVDAPVPAPVPVPVPLAVEAPEMPMADTAPGIPARDADQAGVSPLGLPCDISVTAMAMPVATAALDVMAPCQPDARVSIEHADMVIAGRTDAMGLLTVDIPALQTPAIFTVTFPGGESDTTLVALPDLADYDRVAVQWDGNSELELHAMEMGAEFGGPGHVWEEAPGEMTDAVAGSGGFLVEIGDTSVTAPRVAQIYTFPRGLLGRSDNVRFSVDAPITDGNCGQPVSARTFERLPSGDLDITAIDLTMPGCDAVGDYLVLQNILRDLRLASN